GTLPSGFSAAFGAGSLAVAPGASASTSWAVSSASSVSGGTYGLSVRTSEPTAGLAASGRGSGVIWTPDSTPPSLAIASPSAGATLRGNKTVISATASDASGVQAVEIYVDGVLLGRDTGAPFSVNWNLRK